MYFNRIRVALEAVVLAFFASCIFQSNVAASPTRYNNAEKKIEWTYSRDEDGFNQDTLASNGIDSLRVMGFEVPILGNGGSIPPKQSLDYDLIDYPKVVAGEQNNKRMLPVPFGVYVDNLCDYWAFSLGKRFPIDLSKGIKCPYYVEDTNGIDELSIFGKRDARIPIPSPGSVLLGSIGVGLIGWLRRCRSL